MTRTKNEAERQTKRRYAHEIYPHADEGELRPLDVDVPYYYARATGLSVFGTGWHDAPWRDDEWARLAAGQRTELLIAHRHIALLADALKQGLAGQEAWDWAADYLWDETGECVGDRAEHYGIPFDRIKPYPCGPEPEHHDHLTDPAPGGGRYAERVTGKEAECVDCTEPVEPVQS